MTIEVETPAGPGDGTSRFQDDNTRLSMLAAVVESSDDAIVSKDLDGAITSWNKGAEGVFGYSSAEAVGRHISILIPEDRLDEEPRIIDLIRRGEKVDHFETVRRRKDGVLIDVSLTVSPVLDSGGRVVGASKIAREITEQKKMEAIRRESTIMRRLLNAQEAERNRIARDLHDHLGQRMTGLRLLVESMADRVSDGDGADAEEFKKLRALAAEIDRDVGYLAWELRPTEIDELGLAAA